MKILNKIVSVLALIGMVSCNSELDEVPFSTLTPENVFNTVEDVESATVGMYIGLLDPNTWRVLYPVHGFGTMGTDEWSNNAGNSGEQSLFSRYTLTSASSLVKGHWTAIYKVINRANIVIALTPNIDASQEVINRYLAEAHFMRAFNYMELATFYGGVPLNLEPTTGISSDLGIARSTEDETWDQIISDFEFAEQYLPEIQISGRATKWAAKGLLAKAYMARGGATTTANYTDPIWFEKAANKAYEVISKSGIVLNPTTPGDPMAFAQYGKQFLVSGSNSQESIFEIQFTEGPNGSGWGYRGLQGGRRFDTGLAGSFYSLWGGTGLSSDFALSFDDSDIRFKWSIGTYGLNGASARTKKWVRQWTPNKQRWENIPGTAWGSENNAIVLRMADIYLLYAEASNEVSGNPNSSTFGMSAYDAINTVRNRAQVTQLNDTYIMTDSPYTTVDLLDGISMESFDKTNANYNGRHVYYTGSLKDRFRAAVLKERSWELCFEKQRWFDLKRTGNLVRVASNASQIDKGRLTDAALVDPVDKSDFMNLPVATKTYQWLPNGIQSHNIYLPIPNVEIQLNPKLNTADQNTGY